MKSYLKIKELKALSKEKLKVWFDYWTKHGLVCEECGEKVKSYISDARYGAQAHLVPKNLFPSVADDLQNHLTLPDGRFGCGHHNDYDASWQKAMTMRVWPLVLERFKTFAHKIPLAEARKLPDALREIWDEVQQQEVLHGAG